MTRDNVSPILRRRRHSWAGSQPSRWRTGWNPRSRTFAGCWQGKLTALMTGASVLVTGGAGYIGSHTCKALAAAGYRPVAFDNLSLGHRWAVRWGPLVEADLLDGAAIAAALRENHGTAVIHFAASAYVGDSMRDPAAYYQNNVLTTLQLLGAMLTADVKHLIFSSSCSVYGH